MVFTFLFPIALLLALVLSFKSYVPGVDIASQISANVIAFGAAYVGIFAGASHLALWRENGMLQTVRNFPLSWNVIILSQAVVGIVVLLAQAVVLVVLGMVMGMRLKPTFLSGLLPLVLGYLLFFFLGVIIAMIIYSIAGVSILANIIILPLGFIGGAMMPVNMYAAVLGADHRPVYAPISHAGGLIDDADRIGHLASCLARDPLPGRGLHCLRACFHLRISLEMILLMAMHLLSPLQEISRMVVADLAERNSCDSLPTCLRLPWV